MIGLLTAGRGISKLTGSLGVGVAVGVDVDVEVKVGVGVDVGVAVLVGVGVIVGPNNWPGPQAVIMIPTIIKDSKATKRFMVSS